MHPTEFWWLYESKIPEDKRPKPVDYDSLYKLLKENQ